MTTSEHIISCIGEEAIEIANELIIMGLQTALEAAKVASKANRFGATDRNVLNPTGPTNAERLVAELNDLLAVSDMLAAVGVIPKDWRSMEAQDAKKAKVRKFVECAKTKGAITDV